MADRRVTYQLSILAGKSPEVLRSVAKEAQAAAAAITALSEAQAKAAGSLAGTGRATVQGAISGTSASAVIGAGSAARDPAQVAARAAEKAAADEAKAEAKAVAKAKSDAARAAAKVQRDEDARTARAEREYERQRQAFVRQSEGAIRGKAALEIERARAVRDELEKLGKLDADRAIVIEERITAIQQDAETRSAQLLARGVDPNKAFGAGGTRETAIGGGVLSSFFDLILGKVGGSGGGTGAEAGVRNFSAITEKAADVAGKADTALKTLAGALGVISPEAEAAATAAGDLVGSLEVLLTPAGAVVGAGAGVAASFAAVGAASVAAVFHIAGMADELRQLSKLSGVELVPEASIAGAERAADALGDVSLAGTAMAGVLAGAAAPALEELARDLLAVGLLAAKSFDGMLNGAGAFADYVTDSFGQAVGLGLTWPFELATLAVEKYLTALNSIMEATGVPQAVRAPFIAAQNAVMDLADDIANLRGQAGNAVAGAVRSVAADVGTGYRLLAGEVDGLAEAYADADKLLAGRKAQRAAEAADAAGSPAADAADAIKAEADATAQAIAALVAQVADLRDSTADPLDEIATRYQRLRFELYGVAQAAGEAGDAIAAQARVELDAAEERDRYAAIGESLALTNRDIAASDAQRSADLAADAARPGQVVARIGAASQQIQQGNVVGAVGAATGIPQIAIAGEALGLLATLGELGEEEIRTRGETFARAVGEGLKVLPPLIIDILPDLAIALAEGVADALLDLPAAIGEAIRDAFRSDSSDPNQMVGGALGGAAAGAAVGSIVPVIGTVAGAIGGAIVGGLAGRAADRNEDASRSRSAAESDLAAGIGAQPRTRRPDSRAVSVALTVKGNAVGVQRMIALETGPYGRLTGAR